MAVQQTLLLQMHLLRAQQILLIIEGVIQKPNAGTSTPTEGFALDGSTIKLAAAPATGASYHAVVMGSTVILELQVTTQ